MRRSLAFLALLTLGSGYPAAAAERAVVVELFTSEGCSSCPPADALLAALSSRPDLLALSFHVDYWDRLGWKDPFSSPEATARQQEYARRLGSGTVYTPQIVVDGRWQAVGSDAAEVNRAIAAARRDTASVPLSLTLDHGVARVTIGSGGPPGRVVLIGFDRRRVDTIRGGENNGRTLAHVDVVRGIAEIGRYDGKAGGTIEAAPRWQADRIAVLIDAEDGRILGAAASDAKPL